MLPGLDRAEAVGIRWVGDVDHVQEAAVGHDVGVAAGNRHRVRRGRCVNDTDLDRQRRRADVDHPEAAVPSGDVGVVAGDGHARLASPPVEEADLDRVGGIRDIDDSQAAAA